MSTKNMNWSSSRIQRYMHNDALNYGDDPYCVYIWEKDDGQVFYVGMGKYYRFCSVHEKARSKEFMDIYSEGGCSVQIVAYGMNESEARTFEKRLIIAYNDLGFPLINKQYIYDYYHTPAKLEFMRKLHESKKTESSPSTSAVPN